MWIPEYIYNILGIGPQLHVSSVCPITTTQKEFQDDSGRQSDILLDSHMHILDFAVLDLVVIRNSKYNEYKTVEHESGNLPDSTRPF